MTRPLPFSVLVHDGPMARVYLEVLRREGLTPSHLCFLHDTKWAPGPLLSRFLPGAVRDNLTRWRQTSAMNYWPRQFLKRVEFQPTIAGLSPLHAEPRDLFEKAYGDWSEEILSIPHSHVTHSSFQDPALLSAIERLPTEFVLFTGGGVVPAHLLKLTRKKFLHVHPGFLPHVRGADGLLWSMLTRFRLGASLFLLDEGIDTGEILFKKEIDPLELVRPPGTEDDLYRALFSFYDPLLRAVTLAEYLKQNPTLESLRLETQSAAEGETYHFMHPRLKSRALTLLFPK